MASERPHNGQENHDLLHNHRGQAVNAEDAFVPADSQRHSHPESKTPEPRQEQLLVRSDTPSTPSQLPPFDWDDFEARYERALNEADEHEREILEEAENLSRYFRVWATAASAHDDERAAKRLQTRRRYVNLSEEKMAQKQLHYDEVVQAFESALALLRST